MPIYEYACTACGERTEAKQAFADPPLTECTVCGGSLRKLYSPVGIVFKGSGFYSTDAKKKSKTSSDGAGASSERDKGETKKDTKDAKKDPKPDVAPPAKPTTDKSA